MGMEAGNVTTQSDYSLASVVVVDIKDWLFESGKQANISTLISGFPID
jgi:hypothetical protein